MTNIEIVVGPSGDAKMIFDDRLDLRPLGEMEIRRGSHVEPTYDGRWTADLGPVGGPKLGPFDKRQDALNAEVVWLRQHWLT